MKTLALSTLLALVACSANREPVPNVAPIELASTTSTPTHPAISASTAPTLRYPDHALTGFLPNGKLLLVENNDVYLHDGKRWHARHFPDNYTVIPPDEVGERWWPRPYALLAEPGANGDEQGIELLSQDDLHTLASGVGRSVGAALVRGTRGANQQLLDQSFVFEHRGKLLDFRVPSGDSRLPRTDLEVVDVDAREESDRIVVAYRTASGSLFALTHAVDGSVHGPAAVAHAAAYDSRAERYGDLQLYIGALTPPPAPRRVSSASSTPPPAPSPRLRPLDLDPPMQDDNDGGQLVLFDLQTTTARSRVRIQCKQIVANPLWAPDRGLISVTCGADLVVLDGKRFTELRRVRYVLPGCDNGNNLPAHFITPTVLQIEGCGGIAKLDLATGRYLCGDNEGVLGAEYEMMANPTHPRRKVPKVPVCEETNADFLPISAHYKYSYTEEELIGPNGLHIKMPRPTIAPDESRAAFVRDQKLVVLALPSGTPIQLPE